MTPKEPLQRSNRSQWWPRLRWSVALAGYGEVQLGALAIGLSAWAIAVLAPIDSWLGPPCVLAAIPLLLAAPPSGTLPLRFVALACLVTLAIVTEPDFGAPHVVARLPWPDLIWGSTTLADWSRHWITRRVTLLLPVAVVVVEASAVGTALFWRRLRN